METTAAPRRLVLTRDEAAEAVGVSTSTIDRAIARRELTALRLGPGRRLIRIHPDDLADWLRDARPEEAGDAST